MQINVSEKDQELVEKLLASGKFKSSQEVVSKGLQSLTMLEEEYNATVADVQESLEDVKAGRVHSITDVDRTLREKHGFKPVFN